jgi:hypothetical protein
MDKKIYTVYLVGQITSNPETYEWRDRVTEYFKNNKKIFIINPCGSEWNKTLLSDSKNKENKFSKWATQGASALLVPKDRNYVKKADCIFADLNIYSPDRPILGSFFELAWSYDQPWTMVIGIIKGDKNKVFHCVHPFVDQSVHTWVQDEIDACRLLTDYMDYE